MIYLLRHGAVERDGGGKRYIGAIDIPLSETGRSQARLWAAHFANNGLGEIYCSDLSRCRETATIIGARCSLKPKALTALREINLGTWDGRRFDTIRSLHACAFQQRGIQIADHRPPEGESFRDLQQRVWPAFESIARRAHNPALIVTHAGVIRVILCRMLGMPLDKLFCIGQAYGGLTVIKVRARGYRLHALNIKIQTRQPNSGLL